MTNQMAVKRRMNWGKIAAGLCALLALPAGCGYDGADEPVEEATSDLTIPAGSTEINAKLGQGWDSQKERFLAKCVKSDPPDLDDRVEVNASTTTTIDQRTALNSMGFSLDAKAHYGLASGSVSADFASSMQSSSFSKTFIYRADYRLKGEQINEDNFQLTEVGRQALQNGTWADSCGDEVVYQVNRGGRFFLLFRVDFKNAEAKQEFEGAIQGSASFGEIKVKLQNSHHTFDSSTRMRVEVYQFGGKVTSVSDVFTGIPGVTTATDSAANIKAALSCSLENLDACDHFMNVASAYAMGPAEGSFPKQLANETNDPQSGPAATSYVTLPWSALQIVQAPLMVTTILRDTRNLLAETFDHSSIVRRRLADMKAQFDLEPGEMSDVTNWSNIVEGHNSRMMNAVKACYDDIVARTITSPTDDPAFTTSVNACVDAVTALRTGPNALQFPPESVLNAYGNDKFLLQKWTEMGGLNSILGSPTGPSQDIPGLLGRFRPYIGGMLFWTPAENNGTQIGVQVVKAPIVDALVHGDGTPDMDMITILGYPLGAATTDAAGVTSQSFRGGVIEFRSATGAIALPTKILNKWNMNRTALGLPRDSAYKPWTGAYVQEFDNGVIYLTAQGDALNGNAYLMDPVNWTKMKLLPTAVREQIGHAAGDSGAVGTAGNIRSKLQNGYLIRKKNSTLAVWAPKGFGEQWESRLSMSNPVGDPVDRDGGTILQFSFGVVMGKPNQPAFAVPVDSIIWGWFDNTVHGVRKCGFPTANMIETGTGTNHIVKRQQFERGTFIITTDVTTNPSTGSPQSHTSMQADCPGV